MLFDSHTHANFKAFEQDQAEIIGRALDAGVWMVNVGTQKNTSKEAADLTKEYKNGVYAAIGLHPIHTWSQMVDEEESHFRSHAEEFDESFYESLLHEKVVGVGECGLDYYRLPETSDRQEVIDKQKTEFVKQIEFAKKHKLALIVHCRDAYEDVLEILRREYAGGRGVIHSFTGDWEMAKKFVDFGFFVALNGILTFDKTGRLSEVCKNLPSDRILAETDAPYLAPPPYRGKRNEPGYVRYVVEKMAETRNIGFEEMAQQTFHNACKLFQINPALNFIK